MKICIKLKQWSVISACMFFVVANVSRTMLTWQLQSEDVSRVLSRASDSFPYTCLFLFDPSSCSYIPFSPQSSMSFWLLSLVQAADIFTTQIAMKHVAHVLPINSMQYLLVQIERSPPFTQLLVRFQYHSQRWYHWNRSSSIHFAFTLWAKPNRFEFVC